LIIYLIIYSYLLYFTWVPFVDYLFVDLVYFGILSFILVVIIFLLLIHLLGFIDFFSLWIIYRWIGLEDMFLFLILLLSFRLVIIDSGYSLYWLFSSIYCWFSLWLFNLMNSYYLIYLYSMYLILYLIIRLFLFFFIISILCYCITWNY